jgi:hypothetical protein
MPTLPTYSTGDRLIVRDVFLAAALELHEGLEALVDEERMLELLESFNGAAVLYGALHGPHTRHRSGTPPCGSQRFH